MLLQFYYQAQLTNGYLHFDLSSMTYREREVKNRSCHFAFAKTKKPLLSTVIHCKQTNKQSIKLNKEAAILFLDHQ